MARGFSVGINIGAKLLPSLLTAPAKVEEQIGKMTRGIKMRVAETRVAFREMTEAMSPLAGMAIAGGLDFGFKSAITDSAELAHELQNLRNAGRGTRDVAGAMAAANRAITALPTTTLLDNLKVLNETTGAFGNFQHALDNLTFNQRIGSMMKNVLGDAAGSPGEMFNSIVRAMEIRGSAQNAGRYQREVGELYKSMIFTGGRVSPEEILAYSQGANPYIKGFSLRYLSRIAPSLIQEYGGDKAGTMQNTWTGTILGKSKNIMQTAAWLKLGLLDPKQVTYNKQGNAVGWAPGAMKGTDIALRDPFEFTEKVLIPALKAHGFRTDDQLSLAKALMPLFRDRNANRLANSLTYDQDRARLHKDERLIGQVPDATRAYNQTLRNDPTMAWGAVKSSFANLASVIFGTGKGESPVAVALVHIANGVNMLAGFMQRHSIVAQLSGMLLGFTAAIATLKVFGVALRWVFSPLKLLFAPLRLLGTAFMDAFGPAIIRAFLSFGPSILTGIGEAFALLSNPIGWAVLATAAAVGAGVLVWHFRTSIGHGLAAAWGAIKSVFVGLDWKGIGWAIADSMSFGLASKLPGALRSILPSALGGAPAGPSVPKIAGHRALGGPVWAGRTYLVGEHGPELFRAPSSGAIIPHRASERLIAARAGLGGRDRRDAGAVHVGQIVVQGCHDPAATARAVRAELKKLGAGQAALLTD